MKTTSILPALVFSILYFGLVGCSSAPIQTISLETEVPQASSWRPGLILQSQNLAPGSENVRIKFENLNQELELHSLPSGAWRVDLDPEQMKTLMGGERSRMAHAKVFFEKPGTRFYSKHESFDIEVMIQKSSETGPL
jgi:hypothetical protein